MCVLSLSVVSNALRPSRLQPTRLLCPWDSPGKNTGVGCMPSCRASAQPSDRTHISYVSCIGRWVLAVAPPATPPQMLRYPIDTELIIANILNSNAFYLKYVNIVTSTVSCSHSEYSSLTNDFLRKKKNM